MRKSYYLTYGAKSDDLKHLASQVESVMHIELVETESSYSGVRFKYQGLYADELLIQENKGEWAIGNEDEFPLKLTASFNQGTNKDKLSRMKYLRKQLQKINNLTELESKTIEE